MDESQLEPAPPDWIESLERGEADIAAGRAQSGKAVRQRLRDSIARMEAEPEPVTIPANRR